MPPQLRYTTTKICKTAEAVARNSPSGIYKIVRRLFVLKDIADGLS